MCPPSVFALLDFFGVSTVVPAPRRLPRSKRPAPTPNWIHRRQRPVITAAALCRAHVARDKAAAESRRARAAAKHPRRKAA